MEMKSLTGINIQFPISKMILEGSKIIETRTYPIPKQYIGQEMVLVETPGKDGKFKSRAVAIVKFGPSFKYNSKAEFYADSVRHRVTPDSPWAWNAKKGKWGWPLEVVRKFEQPLSIHKRLGIKYTKNLEVDPT